CYTLGCIVDNTRETLGSLGDAVQGAGTAVQVASDPAGYMAETVRGAAESLLSTVLGGLHEFTQPNLNVEWFRSLYALNFGIAIIIMGAIILTNASRAASGKMSGTALFESIVIDTPRFLVGSMFAPAIAGVLMQLANALANTFLQIGVGNAEVNIVEKVKSSFAAASISGTVSNSVIATLMYTAVLLSLLLIAISLLASYLALNLSSVAFPLGYVWTLNPPTSKFGKRIIYIWIALLFTPGIVFLMLGAAMQWVTNLPLDFSDSALQSIVSIMAVAVALFLVALSPWALQKFAPVLPTGSGADGPSMDAPGSAPGSGSEPNGSATSRLATQNAAPMGSSTEPVQGSSSGRIADLATGSGSAGGATGDGTNTPGSGTISGAAQGAVPQAVNGEEGDEGNDGAKDTSGWNMRGAALKTGQVAQSIGDVALEFADDIEVEGEAQ
ncbi:MAG: hypothetical protein Q4F67_03010, partial [Propionibacteriaceae bacterium]|nr:hypothetical protein [Propionibacteriaceae bacterium]